MRFELYSKKPLVGRKKWYWRLRAHNGEIIAQGEGYYNREDCYHAIKLVQDTTYHTSVTEVTR